MRITFKGYDELMPLKDLKKSKHQRNKHPKEQIERLAKIMEKHGVRHPIHISRLSGEVCFGHGRWEAAELNGYKKYPVVYQDFKDDVEEYSCVQSDNAIATWAELDMDGISFDIPSLGPDFDIDLLGIEGFVLDPMDKAEANAKMTDKFLEAPFSVLSARAGPWQDRKRAWISLGIQSELGRGWGRNDSELQVPGKTLGATPSNQKDLYERMRK